MPRILTAKKWKKDVSWVQMGRNRKLTGKIKSLEKDDEEKQIINNEPAKVS